jgi:hypothetical protein
MKRSVFLFMCALYFKLVISPLYVELIEYDRILDPYMLLLHDISTIIFSVTIPLITYKFLKNKF